MPLDPKVASDELTKAIAKACAMELVDGELTPIKDGDVDTSTYPDDFALGYGKYAMGGMVLGATSTMGDISIISDFLESAKSAGSADVSLFALALAEYWATVSITPGVPSHGGTAVVSVVNNAMAMVGAFQSAIMASMTDKISKPYYFNFVKNIEDMAVSNIIWIVTELIPTPGGPVPTPFPETIS